MNDNPFTSLLGIMREEGKYHNTPSFYFAKVLNELPNIRVSLNNIVLEKEDLLISKWLKDRNDIEFTCTVENGCVDGLSHSHDIDTVEKLQNKLSVGDTVLLVPHIDRFAIIDKVVEI